MSVWTSENSSSERLEAPPPPASGSAVRIGVLLAPLIVGTAAALSNVTNFAASRPAYFAIWGSAHLLAFSFGMWAAGLRRAEGHVFSYLMLGALAGAVEALLVFGVLDGLIVTNGRFPMGGELVVGVEDYIAAVATAVLFAAGAMHRLLRLRPNKRDTMSSSAAEAPSASLTQCLTAAGPVITLLAAVLKELPT